MNLSRHFTIVVVLCMSIALGVGVVSRTTASVEVTKSVAEFGSPKESYSAVSDAGGYHKEDRKTFISSVQAALRNRPEKVVLKEEVSTPPPIQEAVVPVPVVTLVESTSTPEVESPATTTPETQEEIMQPAL
ncbi:MAG: hypothetical protein WAW13_02180 [Minisyncoccia bacterium]